jgi:hypothetical protein
MVHQLAYVSRAVADFDRAALLQLLERSRASNTAAGLTGLLLFRSGQFLQVLEGERERVHALYDRIRLDPRHAGLVQVHGRDVAARDFPDWSMGFFDLADPTLLERPGFSALLHADLQSLPVAAGESMIQTLVRVFRQTFA